MVPTIFVSPEDVVWQESTNPNYTVAFLGGRGAVGTPSTVVPDLSINASNYATTATTPTYQPTNDWRFSWMITAQQTNSANGASFEGNIVVFENRPFAYDRQRPGRRRDRGRRHVRGGKSLVRRRTGRAYGYAAGSDRTVLLRWPAVAVGNIPNSPQPDPVVKVGDWIADVTYERARTR